MHRLAIVIVNYNGQDLLAQCLATLEELALPDTHVVVVENGSTDASGAWLQAHAGDFALDLTTVLLPENLGFAGGNNAGIAKTASEYVLLLNTDAFPKPGAIEGLLAYMGGHPQVGIVGPQLLYPDERWQRSSGRVPTPTSAVLDALFVTSIERWLRLKLWPLTGHSWKPHPQPYIDGACMLIRRAVIDEIGVLDDGFFMYVEDAEYCHRAREHGWGVHLVPSSTVIHIRGGSSTRKNLERGMRMRMESERRFILQNYGERAWQRYLFWRRINYSWRTLMARLLRQPENRTRYEVAHSVYVPEVTH